MFCISSAVSLTLAWLGKESAFRNSSKISLVVLSEEGAPKLGVEIDVKAGSEFDLKIDMGVVVEVLF